MTVSMKEVAERAGVSIATVSNVLNRPDLVAGRTAARVQAVIEQTGFVPNHSARQLRAGTSPMIAVIVPDISNPFFADLSRGVERRAAEHQLAVFVCSTEGDPERERRYLNVVLGQRPRGVLFTPAGELDGPLSLLDGRLRVVLVDRSGDESLCSVAVDDFRGGGLAVQHLHGLGHTSLTWIVGPESVPQCAQRTAGVRYAADLCGMELTEVGVETMTVEAGRAAAAEVLHDRAALPTSFACANDLLALGLESGLMSAGTDVPREASIVGFDDIEFAAAAAVTLTSVARPARAMGSTALDMLLDEELDPVAHVHRQVQFQPSLTVRASTGPPPG